MAKCLYLPPDSPLTNSLNSFARICNPDSYNPSNSEDPVWLKIRLEAVLDRMQELVLSRFYDTAVLSHGSLESALANQLAVKLSNADLSREALYTVFFEAMTEDGGIRRAVRDDLMAIRERDPTCLSYVQCLLNFKGFQACQAHRAAHSLWARGRAALALVIQGRVSEVFAVDIHPAARVGSGVLFDHGTGVVIGETAVVGNGVTILHGVTLGGTGKVAGDRHPKIGDGVLIGAGAKVLGNVRIGENARIGAGAVVLKEIPAGATAVGNPAKVVVLR